MVDAAAWLANYLADKKPHSMKEIREDAKAFGLRKKDLREARKTIGHVITESNENPLSGETDWFWRLG